MAAPADENETTPLMVQNPSGALDEKEGDGDVGLPITEEVEEKSEKKKKKSGILLPLRPRDMKVVVASCLTMSVLYAALRTGSIIAFGISLSVSIIGGIGLYRESTVWLIAFSISAIILIIAYLLAAVLISVHVAPFFGSVIRGTPILTAILQGLFLGVAVVYALQLRRQLISHRKQAVDESSEEQDAVLAAISALP